MKRSFACLALTALLCGCGAAPQAAPQPPAEEHVLAAYTQASEVYDWFGRTPPALDETDSRSTPEGVYFRVADPELPTFDALRRQVEQVFAPALADALLSASPAHFRDFDGALYALPPGRGDNLYLLDTTVAAEMTAEDRWAVTVTFWADFAEHLPQADGYTHTVATVGCSRQTLDYVRTADGWRFSSFCPSDDLDLDAEMVFTINYYQDFEVTGAYQDYSDWQLVCYLIHSDGAYAEAPSDLLLRRFLERPQDILKVLALMDSSPYEQKDAIVAGPGYSAANWLYREDEAAFRSILDTCKPETPAEQAVLDKIRSAYQSASADAPPSPIETEFSLIVPGEKQVLTLGPQEGTFPWGYDLQGTALPAGGGDTSGAVYEVDCGGLRLSYSVSPDDGTEFLFRMSTDLTYDSGFFCTPRGFYCGCGEDSLSHYYSTAVPWDTYVGDNGDVCYIYEPGGDAHCKHIAFFARDGVVVRMEIEDLIDSQLLPH